MPQKPRGNLIMFYFDPECTAKVVKRKKLTSIVIIDT